MGSGHVWRQIHRGGSRRFLDASSCHEKEDESVVGADGLLVFRVIVFVFSFSEPVPLLQLFQSTAEAQTFSISKSRFCSLFLSL